MHRVESNSCCLDLSSRQFFISFFGKVQRFPGAGWQPALHSSAVHASVLLAPVASDIAPIVMHTCENRNAAERRLLACPEEEVHGKRGSIDLLFAR
jgi:hypothetical protein